MILQNQALPVGVRQAARNEPKVNLFVGTVYFVANNRMTGMSEVNANLVLAPGQRLDAEQ